MKRHIQSTHVVGNVESCPVCGKVFKNKYNIDVEENTSSSPHSSSRNRSEEYPKMPNYMVVGDRYMCIFCHHTFNTLPILSRHVAAKHQKQDS
ncbi:Protein of unknown function, partial [Gryllus bimaculatus]